MCDCFFMLTGEHASDCPAVAPPPPACSHYNLHRGCPGCAPGIALLPDSVIRRYAR